MKYFTVISFGILAEASEAEQHKKPEYLPEI
mgnify:CR=1 FL=1